MSLEHEDYDEDEVEFELTDDQVIFTESIHFKRVYSVFIKKFSSK